MNKKYKIYVVAIIAIVVMVLLFQFLVFRIPMVFSLVLNRELYNHAIWVNTEPKVLLMGSSHCNHNINPKIIEELNSLAHGDVVNVGKDAATPFEMYNTYVKNKHKFKNVNLVYYTLEPWIISEKYYRFKPYEQIDLSFIQWSHIAQEYPTIKNMYFFPSKMFIKDYTTTGKKGDNQGFDPLQHHDFKEMDVTKLKTWFEPMGIFPISQFQLYYLNKLKTMIESEGKTFVIVLTPMHKSWVESYMQLDYIDNEITKKFNDNVSSVKVVGSFNPQRYGFIYEDFADDNHLAFTGANKFTQTEFSDIYMHLKLPSNSLKALYSY